MLADPPIPVKHLETRMSRFHQIATRPGCGEELLRHDASVWPSRGEPFVADHLIPLALARQQYHGRQPGTGPPVVQRTQGQGAPRH
jgi:hypothetical protein